MEKFQDHFTTLFAGALIIVIALVIISCQKKTRAVENIKLAEPTQVVHPEWTKNAVIYEVNIRQHTVEGTFKAFEADLPRIKALGADILWLMPVNPIGVKNRKGSLGSYYSVKDYLTVNPEFGTMDDFKSLVKKAHELGLRVIIDWVANHTSWDNNLITEHPDWYTIDSTGKMVAPFDWTDVADLNYDNPDLRKYMTDALKFWVTETDIDGFRCDVAGMVPTDFWENARMELDKIKPVFMLAEAEQADHMVKAFDMYYGWELHHLMSEVSKGKKPLSELGNYFLKADSIFADGCYRMNFLTNHDENSWNGTVKEKFGDGSLAFTILSFTFPGMPLLYSGQEANIQKRLKFFEKDTIDWSDQSLVPLITSLAKLKKENEALWNGSSGGRLQKLETTADSSVYAFLREKNGNEVVVVANLGNKPLTHVNIKDDRIRGKFSELNKPDLLMDGRFRMDLQPWETRVFFRTVKE